MARAPMGSLLKSGRSAGRTAARAPDAETIAIAALLFIAEDEERLARFAAGTGLTPDRLRDAAADSAFLGGVLDLVLAEEALLLAVAQSQNLPPEAIAQARARLPGGAAPAD